MAITIPASTTEWAGSEMVLLEILIFSEGVKKIESNKNGGFLLYWIGPKSQSLW